MAYNRNANPYGIASSEITWNGFADGGRNTNPGTPAVKDKWWEKGASAITANMTGRLFDGIVGTGANESSGGKYGGESKAEFDKNPGKLYNSRSNAYSEAGGNIDTAFEANRGEMNTAMQRKIARGRANGQYKDLSNEGAAKSIMKAVTSVPLSKSYDHSKYLDMNEVGQSEDMAMSNALRYYNQKKQSLIEQRKGLDKWNSDYKAKPNIGKNVVDEGWLSKGPGKGNVDYSELYDTQPFWKF